MANALRRKAEPRHIRLYHSITGTVAWAHLSGNAIKVLFALVRIDDGSKNGQIFYSDRQAALDTGLSRNTCIKAFRELVEKGFLCIVEKGHFDRKVRHATVWRYTWQAAPGICGPTREFEKWRPESEKPRAQKLTRTGAKIERSDNFDALTGPIIEPDIPAKPHKLVRAIGSNNEPQVVYQDGGIPND
ncbi:helix-turn-helix domain-containing protein [Sphingorhabdus contaminans]|uniref:Helix-turn-helix domain-containing protein n=1 Tax=Sphingorhabdus contaminans TaxID=1343899 RepID=A0A553WH02_9SPHN|nr:helix-turn-helix domain-containing protein [Sphingorhabdus contaminans]TSB03971.1 helix-turn-helix domain-containing protein [Sphingorhabdus contaminans]